MNAPARTGSCPPLPPEKQSQPYEPLNGTAGHDGNRPEFAIRKDFVYIDGQREATESPENVNHSRVRWLLEHKRITPRMFEAADRHEKDWNTSLMQPRASSVVVGNGGGNGDMHPNDKKIAAMRRRGDAVTVCGRMYPMVELVVLQNLSVGKASAKLGIHNQAGIIILRVALATLADHFKIAVGPEDNDQLQNCEIE